MALSPEVRAELDRQRREKFAARAASDESRAASQYVVPGLGGFGRTMGTGAYIAEAGLALIGYAYRCIELRAQMYAKAEVKYYSKTAQSERTELGLDHWLVQLNDSRPNPFYSRRELRTLASQSLDYFGVAYYYMPRFGTPTPKQLYVLDPRKVQVQQDPDTFFKRFYYMRDVGGYLEIDPSEIMMKRDVNIFTKSFQTKGYPRVAAVLDALSINAELKQFVNRYFKTDAIPPVLFKSATKVAPDVQAQIKASFNDVLPNIKVGGFMPDGLELVPIVKMSKEVADRLISDATGTNVIREICTTFGVPLSMIEGEKDAYAGAVQVTNNFIQQTIEPLCALHADAEMQYYGGIEQGIEIEYELKLQRDRDFELRKKQTFGFTINELRKEDGEEPIEGGDTYLVPASFLPLSQVLQGAAIPTEAPATPTTPTTPESAPAVPAPAASIGRSVEPKAIPFDKANEAQDDDLTIDPWADEAFCVEYSEKATKRIIKHAGELKTAVVGSFEKLEREVMKNFTKANAARFTKSGKIRKRFIGKELADENGTRIFDVDEFTQEFFNDAEPALKALIRDAMVQALADVGENWDEIQSEFTKRLNDVISESASKITEPVQTVKDELTKLLQKMQDANEGDISNAIREKFGQYKEGRANAIARTTSTAANGSSQRSAWEAVKIEPTWLSSRNADVRPSHRRADGQARDASGYFHVGADKMKSPGTGSVAKENCNCHCSLRPVPKTSKHIDAVQRMYDRFIVREVYRDLIR